MVRRYVPEAGDIVSLNFDLRVNHEHAGHQPVLVISPSAYNTKTALMLCCPITMQIKRYPFEVEIAGDYPRAVLADQVKSLDWIVRKAKHGGVVSTSELADVKAKIFALVGELK